MTPHPFDHVAGAYEAELELGLRLTGDSAGFYAQSRLLLLRDRLAERGFRAEHIVDFGCGTGRAVPLLRTILSARTVLGVDVSPASLAIARQQAAGDGVGFQTPDEPPPAGGADLVYCNGVFHHIPPAERPAALDWIRTSLRPGGLFALWENNPWNPGTRLVMSRIPFDRAAVKLSPPSARRLLQANGFRVLATDHAFFFPAPLKALRPLERYLRRLPLGGQYLVLAGVQSPRTPSRP